MPKQKMLRAIAIDPRIVIDPNTISPDEDPGYIFLGEAICPGGTVRAVVSGMDMAEYLFGGGKAPVVLYEGIPTPAVDGIPYVPSAEEDFDAALEALDVDLDGDE
jgi:hypothetical protein